MSQDKQLIYEASKRLYERKNIVGPMGAKATDERIGSLLVGTDLTIETTKQIVNEWLAHFEKRMGITNPDVVDENLGDILMDAFLTGVLYEQARSNGDGT